MFAGFQDPPGSLEMSIIGRRDTHDIDVATEQLLHAIRLAIALKISDLPRRRPAIGLRPAPGATGHGGQLDVDHSESTIVQTTRTDCFEERAIGLVKDHTHAHHAGSQATRLVRSGSGDRIG